MIIPMPLKPTLLKRSEAIRMLNVAIKAYGGDTGPGSWTIDENYPSIEIRTIALDYIWPSADLPKDQASDAPWKLWGGDRILAAAGVHGHGRYSFPYPSELRHTILIEVLD